MIQLKAETAAKFSEQSGHPLQLCVRAVNEVNLAIRNGHPTAKQRRTWSSDLEWVLWNRYVDDANRAAEAAEDQTPENRIDRLERQMAQLLAHFGLKNIA